MIGTHIGNYRIVTELGSGAMGEVYFAEHVVMGRRAAIKIIRQELSSNGEMVQRFINEARAVNQIGHPNIVEITDFGQLDGRYYIIMELLEGETLQERLDRAYKLDEAAAIAIGMQVTDALSAAHALGIVHRDLKPENIYLSLRGGRSDFVKVLDFGIAKLTTHAANGGAQSTVPGMVIGTPHYMSPEQCRGDVLLDHRSDVYSLGVVLYQMVTGVLPLDGDSLHEVLMAHMGRAPLSPREHCPELSERVEHVILRALHKQPELRFSDMRELRDALDAKTHAKSTPAARPQLAPPVFLAPAAEPEPLVAIAALPQDPEQSERVGGCLAQILVERIRQDKLLLPTMPSAALECIAILNKPDAGLAKLAELIGRDPILAPQIIRRAKSAAHGSGMRVRSVEQAVSRLGARELRSCLIELSSRKIFESRNPAIRKAFRSLWDHSVAVGFVARWVAQRQARADVETAYLAGLLHDIGKPVAAALLLEAERTTVQGANEWMGDAAWLGAIDECHREVGVAIAHSWGLPDEIARVIAGCNDYDAAPDALSSNVVCFANAYVKRQGIYSGDIDEPALDMLIARGQQLFGLDAAALQALLTDLRPQAHQKTLLA